MSRPEAELPGRLLHALAGKQGGMLNRRRLASSLEISVAELSRQLGRLEAGGEIRLLAPCREYWATDEVQLIEEELLDVVIDEYRQDLYKSYAAIEIAQSRDVERLD